MTTTNPPAYTLRVLKDKDSDNLRLGHASDGAHFFMVSDVVSTPFPIRDIDTGKTGFLTISHGPNGSKFADYLREVDQFMEGWVQRYNEKFQPTEPWTYEPMLRNPMKKDSNGQLVVNQEALDKYGQTTNIRIAKVFGRYLVAVEQGGKKYNQLGLLDFEGLIHPGSKFRCALSPSVWSKNGVVQIVPRAVKINVLESNYHDIDLSTDQTSSDHESKFIDLGI